MNILEIGLILLTAFFTVSFWVALFFEDDDVYYTSTFFWVCLILWCIVVAYWSDVFTTPLW